ncbi:MAG: hypothetical protein WBB07_15200 [Mycobacterium sp.]
MPKSSLPAHPIGALDTWPSLANWQVAGVTLAAIGSAVFGGVATLIGTLLLAPVVYALARLHSSYPQARCTSELIATPLGARFGHVTSTLQIVAYTLLAVGAARTAGLWLTAVVFNKPEQVTGWPWPVFSLAALLVAAVVVYALPTAILVSVAAVLAAVAVLIYFYLGLAVTAWRMSDNTIPYEIPALVEIPGVADDLAGWAALAGMALVVTGFEVATVRNRRLRSGWPMAVALGITAFCALTVWLAGPTNLALAVNDLLGRTGELFLNTAGVALAAAALLVLLWAAITVLRQRLHAPGGPLAISLLTLVMAWLVVLLWFDPANLASSVRSVPALLLMVVYVLVALAFSRLPQTGETGWWLRVPPVTLLAAAVALPVLYAGFTADVLVDVALAAVVTGAAFVAAALLNPRGEPNLGRQRPSP